MLNIDKILDLLGEMPVILDPLRLMSIKQKLNRDINYDYLQGSASAIRKLKMRDS